MQMLRNEFGDKFSQVFEAIIVDNALLSVPIGSALMGCF